MAFKLAEAFVSITGKDDKLKSDMRQTRSFVKSSVSSLASVTGGILAAAGIGKMIEGIRNLARGMIAGNAEFERYAIQFEVLLGNAAAARDRLQELQQFAATTPFQLPDVVRASKMLQTFGGTSLATGDSLRMVGDMAAAAGTGFSEVAFWVGRFVSSLKAGRPFGEAAARMQELGLLSGEARSRLEEMQKSGASGGEIFEEFRGSMSRFNGMMGKLSQSGEGLLSTLKDLFDQALRTIGEPFFEVAKQGLGRVVSFMGSPETQAAIKRFAEFIQETIDAAIFTFKNFPTIVELQLVKAALAALKTFPEMEKPAEEAVAFIGGAFAGLQAALGAIFDNLKVLWEIFTEEAKSGTSLLGVVIQTQITGPLMLAVDALELLTDSLSQLPGEVEVAGKKIKDPLVNFAKAFKETRESIKDSIEGSGGLTKVLEDEKTRLENALKQRPPVVAPKPELPGREASPGGLFPDTGSPQEPSERKKERARQVFGFAGITELSRQIQQSILPSKEQQAQQQTAKNTAEIAKNSKETNKAIKQVAKKTGTAVAVLG